MNKRLAISNTGLLIALLIITVVVIGVVAVMTVDTTGERPSLSSDYLYDLSAFDKIDPALVLYTESLPVIPTGFQNPVGVVVGHNDNIYVAGDKAIKVFVVYLLRPARPFTLRVPASQSAQRSNIAATNQPVFAIRSTL